MPTTYAIPDGRVAMAATLWTGTGVTRNVTGVGFQPDLVWLKIRSSADSNGLFDSVRGAGKRLQSNDTNAEATTTAVQSAFISDGFTVGTDVQSNGNGSTYVGWSWKASGSTVSNTAGSITSTVDANTTAGFSIVTYTGTGANATVGHGLGVAPKMLIVRNRTGGDWKVYNANVGNTYQGFLNDTAAFQGSSPTLWNSTTPTSTVFSIGTNSGVNGSGNTIVAYCFAEVAGYSKFGSYTGNGSTDGPFIYCGFRPRWLMFKRSDGISTWEVVDTSRANYNVVGKVLQPNTTSAELNTGDYANLCDALSNGFKIRSTSSASNTGTVIYAAFAENPFKYANAR